MDWQTLRNRFMRDIGGDAPGAQLEDKLIQLYTDHPEALERAMTKIALAFKAGKIRSPWGALSTEADKATDPARNPTHDKGASRNKAVERAEQWMRTAGLMFDRDSEIVDELFGDRGPLNAHRTDELEQRILALWTELRPLGEQTEREAEERGRRYQEQQAIRQKIAREAHLKAKTENA